ncbi:MAG TPA: efflux RND transporter periplasmic adaptor subunit [Terriglobia bacterium]|nr:efflux RND transporter periplasmic adaptor subunit [Terriglobia bacterium]
MIKRMILMLALTGGLVASLGFVKFRQIQDAMGQAASFQPPPEAVTTIIAQQDKWPSTLNAIGTMAAVQGVTVSADLPGIVEQIAFESGGSVREGDLLVQLDTRQEQAQLAAVEAARDLARLNFERMHGLVNEGAITRADYDRAAAEQKQTEAKVEEIRATIARKTIRAPFSGILGIRQVNLGQYLSGGDAVVPLQSLDPIYVNFGVPQQDAGQAVVGRNVRITVGDLGSVAFTGRVTAINSVVDEATRNVQVQATLANPKGTLRPGMFVQTEVLLGASRPVVTLPAPSISYAPYGDSVFVVTELKDPKGQTYRGVRQQFVKLGPSRGDQIAVLSGLKPGEEIVSSGVFKLRNGAAVLINNKVQPANKPAPKPEDS